MNNPTISYSVRKLKVSNIKSIWLLLGQSKVHHKRAFMKNLVSNHLKLEGEFDNYECFIKKYKFEISKHVHKFMPLINNDDDDDDDGFVVWLTDERC